MKTKAGVYVTALFILLLVSFIITVLLAGKRQQDLRSRAQVTIPSTGGSCDLVKFAPRDQCPPGLTLDALKYHFADFRCVTDLIDRTIGDPSLCQTADELKVLAAAQCMLLCRSGGPSPIPPIQIPPITPPLLPTGSGSNTSPTPTRMITPPFGIPTPISCQEGVKDAQVEKCILPITTPASNVVTPITTPGMKFTSFVCWDGSTSSKLAPSSCLNDKDYAALKQAIIDFCAGKKAPECSVTTTIIPTVAVSTLAPTGPSSCVVNPMGDTDHNGKTDIVDFELWRRQFIREEACTSADFNCDGLCRLSGDWETLRKAIVK